MAGGDPMQLIVERGHQLIHHGLIPSAQPFQQFGYRRGHVRPDYFISKAGRIILKHFGTPMDLLARLLFHELADLAPAEREKIFTDRRVAPQLRAEVESLLSFDADNSSSLTSCVSDTAAEIL